MQNIGGVHGLVTRETLSGLAKDGLEESIARHFADEILDHLNAFTTKAERQFIFRCFWVPFELMGLCEERFRSPHRRYSDIYQFSPVIAHSRMLKEMVAWGYDPRVGWWPKRTARQASKWWMERFDSYRNAIECAFQYWVWRKCPDCCHPNPEIAKAARFGFIERMSVDGLTDGCLNELRKGWKERERTGSRESEFFHKYANPNGAKAPRWDHPNIDLWLHEIWPLVKRYAWIYAEVAQLAFIKFGGEKTHGDAAVLYSAAAMKERCQLLRLRLSAAAQQHRGRPKKTDTCDLLGSNDDEVLRRLCEIAVSIEPFTRLFEGSSKESLSFACPRLKRRGKKPVSSPPFFESPVPQNMRHVKDSN